MRKSISVLAMMLIATASGLWAREKSPLAAGLALGTGAFWVIHLKPEIIVRFRDADPSVSLFVEVNTVILVSEASFGVSLNFQNGGSYMNSFYAGSGAATSKTWGEEPSRTRTQLMLGWELKKEYGWNFGYFLNAGFEYFIEDMEPYPKLNAGFFFLPGF